MKEDAWSCHKIRNWIHIATWGDSTAIPMNEIVKQLQHGRHCSIVARVDPGFEAVGLTPTHLVQVDQVRMTDERSGLITRMDFFLCEVETVDQAKTAQ